MRRPADLELRQGRSLEARLSLAPSPLRAQKRVGRWSMVDEAREPLAPRMGLLARMTRRKSVEELAAAHDQGELKRALGPLSLIFLGIGTIIGTGIFVLTGQAAAQYAGPGIMISFVITGVLCALVALCYAELASAIPVSGSAYSYSYASGGEFLAWIMGLLLLLEYGIAASTVAVGWSGYLVSLLGDMGVHIPGHLTAGYGVPVTDPTTGEPTGAIGQFNLLAVLALSAVTALLIAGVSESAVVNNIIVLIKVSVVIAFIVIGAGFVDFSLWRPLIPPQVPPPPPGSDMSLWAQIGRALGDVMTGNNTGQYGVGGIITGAATIFFAYLGFEAVSTAGAESKNPRRDMPIGILGSLAICTVLYILTAGVLVGVVPYANLNNPAPIATAVNQMGLPWFAVLVKLGALSGLSSVMLVLLYGQTRIFYTMARDGLLPEIFARVHARFKTPWVNTALVGFIAAAFAGVFGIADLSNYTNVGTLAAFAIVCLTVLYLRFADPRMPRPFRTPLFPLTPILAVLMCVLLIMSIMADVKTRYFFGWYLGVGTVIYFVYGMWRSKLEPARRTAGR
jgi:APA family basic amino acid/polyamine antiporter